ncbi:MAG: hypothetical protein WBC22_15325 [Sedimentisphaerales bacterium]
MMEWWQCKRMWEYMKQRSRETPAEQRASYTEVPEGEGIVVMNPEYGLRLGELESLEKEYKRIGDFFKKKCAGYTGYLLTANKQLAAKVGLKASRRMIFYNGKIECRLLKYELYEGIRQPQNSGQD